MPALTYMLILCMSPDYFQIVPIYGREDDGTNDVHGKLSDVFPPRPSGYRAQPSDYVCCIFLPVHAWTPLNVPFGSLISTFFCCLVW